MREIKFRGFCNLEKKMYQNFYIEDHAKFAFMNELINSAQQRYTILQYTGLKDKNDVEIYEGDVIKIVGPYTPTIREFGRIVSVYERNFVVVSEVVGFTLRCVADYAMQLERPEGLRGFCPIGYNGGNGSVPPIDNQQFWAYKSSFEIIGNVYENPELIGEQK